jgi:hypothetical protein
LARVKTSEGLTKDFTERLSEIMQSSTCRAISHNDTLATAVKQGCACKIVLQHAPGGCGKRFPH